MKKTLLFIFAVSLFSTFDAFSQVDRRIGAEQRYNKPRKKQEKKDPAELWADYMKKELKLDDLQYAVFKTTYEGHKDQIDGIIKSEAHSREKRDQLKVITDQINEKVNKVLSPDQQKKYQELLAEQEKKILTH